MFHRQKINVFIALSGASVVGLPVRRRGGARARKRLQSGAVWATDAGAMGGLARDRGRQDSSTPRGCADFPPRRATVPPQVVLLQVSRRHSCFAELLDQELVCFGKRPLSTKIFIAFPKIVWFLRDKQTNKKFNVCFFLMISFGGGLWVYSSGLSVDAIEMKCGVDFRSKG